MLRQPGSRTDSLARSRPLPSPRGNLLRNRDRSRSLGADKHNSAQRIQPPDACAESRSLAPPAASSCRDAARDALPPSSPACADASSQLYQRTLLQLKKCSSTPVLTGQGHGLYDREKHCQTAEGTFFAKKIQPCDWPIVTLFGVWIGAQIVPSFVSSSASFWCDYGYINPANAC